MSNVSIFISFPVGILGFLYFFWKSLKEDYTSDQIFSGAFIVIGFLLFGFILGFLGRSLSINGLKNIFNFSGIWFWTAVIFSCIGFCVAFYKLNLRLFETLEAVTLGSLFLLFTIFIVNAVLTKDVYLLIFSLLTVALIPFFSFLTKKYKLFNWYKSGKLGFAGLVCLAAFFLFRVVFALIDPMMLSFVGKFDAILSSITSFLFFIVLYNLSGS
ncbi:MAG TPA: hypothetical protein VG895_01505 [Patescibacteria group bacterium]|nr:hypothetical protein [Patescibacteria group bacterium]